MSARACEILAGVRQLGERLIAASPDRRRAPADRRPRADSAASDCPGLHALRIANPRRKVFARVRQGARRPACCASPCASGRAPPGRAASVPGIVWHPAQRVCMNTSRPRRCDRALTARAPAARMASSQRSKSGVGLGDDIERHVRVLQPAELGALAAEEARAVGLYPDRVV